MPVTFHSLSIGSTYDRPFLASLWGYESHQAISRGVIMPRGTNFIILFVTHLKQASLTQYNDFIDGAYLFWEGEAKHGADVRITSARQDGAEIHLFYREIHHAPFIYHGPVTLESSILHADRPSEFIFKISSVREFLVVQENDTAYFSCFGGLEETTRKAVIESRVGQALFRKDLIKIWRRCAVTNLANPRLLKAAHIKPWRVSNNDERLDPYNGLLLAPNIDAAFDAGYISFEDGGNIILSDFFSLPDRRAMGLEKHCGLQKVPGATKSYLCYHREHVFLK